MSVTIPAATAANTNSTEHLMHKIHVEFDRAYHSGGFGSPFPPSNAPMWMSHHDVAEGGRAVTSNWQPHIDIEDGGDILKFRCDLPGVHREHINVHLRGGRLVINGKRECEKNTEEGTHVIRLTPFSRAFSLPEGVTPDDVHAEIGEGVLHVQVRKPAAMLKADARAHSMAEQQQHAAAGSHAKHQDQLQAPQQHQEFRNL